ncbi:MAG: D-alanyl-D-alanine carboxypeptidase/D-alanyl-D-alanine-endopeptidase [Rhodothermales bacterium]|nr:D-alanyl-D-alanine carboxypeptidase/D-alanyl-D-alanine-endopeptidase [Rhodothermales bacterium]
MITRLFRSGVRRVSVVLILTAGTLISAGCATGLRMTEDGIPVVSKEKQLDEAVSSFISEAGMDPAWWGVHVVRVDDGRDVYKRFADHSFIPASNIKLYTTAAGLTLLGPEFTYETRLYAVGPVENGVLHGDLVVRGSGDPVIGPRFAENGDRLETFRSWAASLKAAGIDSVAGNIIGDDDLFDDLPLGAGWMWDDEITWYSAEVGALTYHDNTIDIRLDGRASGEPAVLSWEPAATSYVRLRNESVTVPSGPVDEGYERERASNEFRLTSRVPVGGADTESLSISNATLYFVHVLSETLRAEGIGVGGGPVDVDDLPSKPAYDAPDVRSVAVHRSVPLKKIAAAINKPSHNLYAEQLLRSIGAYAPVDTTAPAIGSAASGLEASMHVFGAAGVDTVRIRLADGSGLSRYNIISPRMTTSLLRYMAVGTDDSTRAAFMRSLPIAGVDGSLAGRMRSGPAYANALAKTGTMSHASALAGYVTTARGTQLAFSIMGNNYILPTSRARDVQDRIVQILAASEL